jgi:hypothetical protein
MRIQNPACFVSSLNTTYQSACSKNGGRKTPFWTYEYQFFIKKTIKKFPPVNFFLIFGHQNPGSWTGSGYGSGSSIRKTLHKINADSQPCLGEEASLRFQSEYCTYLPIGLLEEWRGGNRCFEHKSLLDSPEMAGQSHQQMKDGDNILGVHRLHTPPGTL